MIADFIVWSFILIWIIAFLRLIDQGLRYRRLKREGRTLMCFGETEIAFEERNKNKKRKRPF